MLKKVLYDYQVEGVNFMFENKKCLNLDDCGLGKTAQTIGLIDKLNSDRPHKVMVVVKPDHVLQWVEEIEKFSDLKFTYVDGSKKKREKQYRSFMQDSSVILLINYNKVQYDFKWLKMVTGVIDTFLFDEAFALKSPDSLTNNRFEELTVSADRVVMLTATPVGATLYDFYNIMKVMHIPLLSDEDFISEYVRIDQTFVKMGYRNYRPQQIFDGSKNIEEFREEYSKYFIRRENKDNFSFKLNIHNCAVDYSAEQLRLCYNLQQQYINQGPDDKPIPAVKVYSQFAQIADAPYLVNDKMSKFSPKLEMLISLISKSDEQFVVYAKYLAFHSLIEERFNKEGITFSSISGKDSLKEKNIKKKAFISGGVRVLLITGAGKEGLNLQVAHNIVLLDVPDSASDCFQFLGRVYRNGQENDVNAYFIFTRNSLEEDKFNNIISRQRDIDVLMQQDKASLFNPLEIKVNLMSFLKRDYTGFKKIA